MPLCQDIDKLVVTTVVDPGQFATRVTRNQLYFPSEMGHFSSPEITGKIYLPSAPAAAERRYTIVNNTGEFFYPHPDAVGTTFIMGFKVATPTDSGENRVVKPRTLTAICGTGIDGVCQWLV